MRLSATFACVCLLVGAVPVSAQVPAPAVPPASAPPAALPAPTPIADVDQWAAMMERWNEIKKVPRTTAIRLDKKWAKPNAVTPWSMEIVGEDEEFLYLKNLPMEDPSSPMHKAWLQHEAAEANLWRVKEVAETYFILDPFEEIVPPPFSDRITLEERSAGLPNQGRWQMGFAAADLNGDAQVDLVFPPARLGRALPEIFFGSKTGWSASTTVKWPQIHFDYGDVGVADFDGDGNLDIAIACHFLRNYVLYGDGKGDFTRHVELPRINMSVSSRALAVADFDGDRRPDIAFLSELDVEMGTSEVIGSGLLMACLNTKTGWRAVEATGGRGSLFGDKVAAGDFDADGDVDIVVSSHKNVNRFLVFTNEAAGATWKANAPTEFPFRAYVRAVAAANLDGIPGDEAVMGFHQNIQSGSLTFPRNAIAVYSFNSDRDGLTVKSRTLVDVDATSNNDYTCAAVGDLDGDGRPDLVLGRQTGAVRVFLRGLDGTFIEDLSPELSFGDAFINHVAIIELASGGPRALVISASDGNTAKGAIRCFLPRRKALDSGKGSK